MEINNRIKQLKQQIQMLEVRLKFIEQDKQYFNDSIGVIEKEIKAISEKNKKGKKKELQ